MPLSSAELQGFLSRIQPFSHLTRGEIKEVGSHLREAGYQRGQTIYNEGDAADSVWVVFEGRVQILKYTSEGRTFAIESLGRGELFGTLCRLGGNGKCYPCTAVAAGPTKVLRILDRVFLDFYVRSPGMVRGVCALCSRRLKDVQDLRCMGQESVPVRVATILIRLFHVHGPVIPFTKKEIAELSGTTLETTFRVLTQFQKKGLLLSLHKKIQIKKFEDLKTLTDTL